MKPPSSHAKALRHEQAAQVCAAHRFLVAADELGDFERSQQPVRQALELGDRLAGNVIVDLNGFRIRVHVSPHGLLRGSTLIGRPPSTVGKTTTCENWAPAPQ
jgi:hypothetical protein